MVFSGHLHLFTFLKLLMGAFEVQFSWASFLHPIIDYIDGMQGHEAQMLLSGNIVKQCL